MMKIRVFPSHEDCYNSIVVDTDVLPVTSNSFHPQELRTLYISDLITVLISEN